MWQRGGSILGPILNQFCVTSFMNDPLTVLKHFQSATPKKLVQISTIGSANSHPPFTASNFCAEISTLTIFRRTPNCWWCRDVSTPNGALFMPTKSQKCNRHKIDIFIMFQCYYLCTYKQYEIQETCLCAGYAHRAWYCKKSYWQKLDNLIYFKVPLMLAMHITWYYIQIHKLWWTSDLLEPLTVVKVHLERQKMCFTIAPNNITWRWY